MPDKKTISASQAASLFADDDTDTSVNIDPANFKEEIASHESKGVGDYEAENDSSSAKGRYQFLWGTYGDRIKKETGVKDSDEFLKNHDAQDQFFDNYTKTDVIPWVQQQKEDGNTRGLSDKQLGQLYHFIGPGGAEKYLQSGHYKVPGRNVPIDSYLEERNPQKTISADMAASLFEDDQSIPQKKSPDVSANGLATASQPGQNTSLPSDYTQTQQTPAPQMSQQDIVNNTFGKDLQGNPIVSDQTQAVDNAPAPQEDINHKTANATSVIANDIFQHANEIPDYSQNLNSAPLNQPGNIAHDITNPRGNPAITGQYVKSRIEQLKLDKHGEIDKLAQQGGATDPDYQNELAAINAKYDGQIKDLADAGIHTTALQLANNEYTQKKYTPQEATKKIDDLNSDYKEKIKTADPQEVAALRLNYEQQKSEITQNAKYDATQLGIQQQILLGNKQAEDDQVKYKNGLQIPDDRKVAYQAAGLDILQTGAKSAAANNQDDAAKEMDAHSDNPQERLVEDNPKYFRKIWGAQVGSYLYNNENNPLYGSIFSRPELTEDEIKAAGKKAGLSKDQVALLKPEDVPTMTSMPAQAIQSAINSFDFRNDNTLTGNVPAEQHQLNNWRGIAGEIAGGAGTVAGFIGQSAIGGELLKGTEMIGDVALNAKRYETASNLVPLAISNYNNSYDQSKTIIGDKPKDEMKRQAYSIINAILGTALMSIDPATAIGKDALGMTEAGKDVINTIKSDGLEKITQEEFKSKIQKVLEGAMTSGEHTLTQAGIMATSKAAQNVTDMIFDPEHRHAVMDNVGDAAIQAGVAMLIPSIAAGAQSTQSQTPANKALLYDIGSNSKQYRIQVGDLYRQGRLTKDETQQAIANINTAAGIVNFEIPKLSVVNQKELNPEQKQDYAWNLLQEKQLVNQLTALPNGEKTQTGLINSQIKDLDNQRQEILNKAGDVPGYKKPIRIEPEENSEPQPTGAIATEAKTAEETPATKKSSKELENTKENVIPLSPTEITEPKTSENEKRNSRSNVQTGQQNDEINRQENGSGNINGQVDVEDENGNNRDQQQEAGILKTEEQNKEKAATEQPLGVKKKRKWVISEEPEEIPVTVTPELQTRDDGTAKGKPEADTEEQLKEAMLNHPEKPIDHLLTNKAEGESQNDFTGRIAKTVETYAKPETEGGLKDNSLLVTHSNVIKLLEAAYDPKEQKFDFNQPSLNEKIAAQSTETGSLHQFKIKDAEGNEKTIHVARHGETTSNLEDLQRKDNDNLTPQGKEDAKDVAAQLKDKGIKPPGIISSDLSRAQETAGIIQKELSTEKPEENASTQSKEQQQESAQQSSKPEHARTEPAGSKETPAGPESSNSDKRSEAKKEVTPTTTAELAPDEKLDKTNSVKSFETSQGSKYESTPDGKFKRTKTATGEEFEPQDHTVFIKFKDDEQKQRFLEGVQDKESNTKVSLIGKGEDKKVVLTDKNTGKVLEEAETTTTPTKGYNTYDQRRYSEDGKEMRESHIGNEVTKINYSESEDNLLPPQPAKPLHEMTGDELSDYHKELKDYNKNLDKVVLGDKYEEYEKSQRISNSSFSSEEARKKADKTIDEIESGLSEKQQDALFGRNLPKGFIANDEDVRDYRNKVEAIESSQSENELAKDISQSLIDLNNAPEDFDKFSIKQKLAIAAMNTAKRLIAEREYDIKKVMSQTLEYAYKKFDDKNDAEFMLSKYIDLAVNKTNSDPTPERSVAPEAKSAKELPAPKPLSIDEKIKLERTIHQRLIDQGKEAEKERLKAIKGKDPEAIQKATDKVNNLKDKVLAKEDKIDKLINNQKNDTVFSKSADWIEKTYEKNKAAHAGESYATIMGLNPKIADHVTDYLVARTVEALRDLHNVDLSIRRGIRLTKEKWGEEAKDLSYDDIEKIKEAGIVKGTTLKAEPNLPIDHEENAKDILADILSGKMSHEDVIKEIMDEIMENREGKPVSDHVSENAKAKILNYLDYHIQNDATSIKNATTQLRRQQFGLNEEIPAAKKEFGKTWDEAQQKIEDNPQSAQNLIQELSHKARPLTDVENALLLHHQNTKEIELLKTNEGINKAAESDDKATIEEYKATKARVLDELQQIYDINKAVGTENARGLASRRMMVDRKYSLVNMIAEKRATANEGKPLSDEQQAQIEKLHAKVKETQEAYDKYVQESKSQILDLQRNLLKSLQEKKEKTAATGKPPETKPTESKIPSKSQKVANKLRAWADKIDQSSKNQAYSSPIPVTPKMVADSLRLIADGIEKGGEILDLVKTTLGKISTTNPGIDEQDLEKEINKAVIDAGILEPSPERRKVTDLANLFTGNKLDREAVRLKVAADRAKEQVEIELKKDQQRQLSKLSKAQNLFIKWRRFALLSNPLTMGKLAMAGFTRLVTTPLEDIVGGAYSIILPQLDKGAIGEGGGLHINETAEAYKNAFMQWTKDAYDIMHTGKTEIDVLFGKTGELPPEAIDFFGQLHSATKAPFKRALFERSLSKRLRRNIAAGVDVSDPMVQTSILNGAYKDANRAIFMQDNKVADGYQNLIRWFENNDAKGAATVMQFLTPFVKVPSNIVAETGTHIYGVPVAAYKLLHAAFTKGIADLSEEQKDIIFRNLKKGTIGLAAMALGYFNSQNFGGYYQPQQKIDEDDAEPMGFKIGGHKVPAWIGEAPIFQVMQFGATVRRISDKFVNGEKQGFPEGLMTGLLDVLQSNPLAGQPLRISALFNSSRERKYYVGELAKSTIDPAIITYLAKVTDPADEGNPIRKMLMPENKRKSPKTIAEHIKSGLPFTRETLEAKDAPVPVDADKPFY